VHETVKLKVLCLAQDVFGDVSEIQDLGHFGFSNDPAYFNNFLDDFHEADFNPAEVYSFDSIPIS
jgi:hypothetical protein